MRDELDPTVGKWYHDVELDEPFRVAAIDEEREVVEVRYLDGETDEIALEDWPELDLEPATAPEEEAEGEDDDERESGWREPDAGEAEDWEDDEDDEDEEDEKDDWDEDQADAE